MRAMRALEVVTGLAVVTAVAGCVHYPEVQRGEVPELGPDQGILVLHLEAYRHIDHVLIDGLVRARDLDAEGELRLLVAPAGSHAFTRIDLKTAQRYRGWWYVGFRDDPRARFDVKAGTISYPGTLAWDAWGVRVANRSASVLRYLQRHHGALLERMRLEYTGYARDDFLRFYDEERRRSSPGPAP